MKKTFIYSLMVSASALLLTACGSNTKQDVNDVPASERGIYLDISCSEAVEEKDSLRAHCYIQATDGNSRAIEGLDYSINLVTPRGTKVAKIDNRPGSIYNEDPIRFYDATENFMEANVNTADNLIIFGGDNGYDPSSLGNWKIASVGIAELILRDISYNLQTAEKLAYIIGSSPGAHIEAYKESGSDGRDLDAEGLYYFDLVYDSQLKRNGDQIAIGAHTEGGNRVGVGIILDLSDPTTP